VSAGPAARFWLWVAGAGVGRKDFAAGLRVLNFTAASEVLGFTTVLEVLGPATGLEPRNRAGVKMGLGMGFLETIGPRNFGGCRIDLTTVDGFGLLEVEAWAGRNLKPGTPAGAKVGIAGIGSGGRLAVV
jgi:hypothetical protein